MIEAEHKRSIDALEKILGTKVRLIDNPMLAQSIKNRFPYIAPLNYLQAELIRRHRAGQTDPEIREGILTSINGVAAGLRNTG
jgi:phosphoenolpyruvate carboxylase